MSIKEHPPRIHVPVLLDATLRIMAPTPGESYLDLTAGYGGHATAFLEKTDNYKDSVLVDRDEHTLGHLENLQAKGAQIRSADFVTECMFISVDRTKCGNSIVRDSS